MLFFLYMYLLKVIFTLTEVYPFIDVAVVFDECFDHNEEAALLANDYDLKYYGKSEELGLWHFRKIFNKSEGINEKRFMDNIKVTMETDKRIEKVYLAEFLSRQKRENTKENLKKSNINSPLKRNKSRQLKFFNDPYFINQWYLQCSDGHHLNVVRAWKRGYTGKNVSICIIDDGIDYTHQDLIKRYRPDLSFDFNDLDDESHDPSPTEGSDYSSHGTKCAGVASAEADNMQCGVGIAFRSFISGFRLLDGPVTSLMEARALSYLNKQIQIKSMSWGPLDNGKFMEKPNQLSSMALDYIGSEKNGERSTIHVWASGNGGMYNDHCGADGYSSHYNVISVSAIDANGRKTFFDEQCASIMCVAYVAKGSFLNLEKYGMITTGLQNACDFRFTGTSAAAPVAAGIFALALEANPNLTFRDMMHLIAATARVPTIYDANLWWINGAGYHVSHYYGFGVLNAKTLVQKARKWQNVHRRRQCSVDIVKSFASRFVKKDEIEGTSTMIVANCDGVESIEHVVLRLSVDFRRRGNIKVTMISPAGTPSLLLNYRNLDVEASGFDDFPFTSIHNWGESPIGEWRIQVSLLDASDYDEEKLRKSIKIHQLVIMGTKLNANMTRSVTSHEPSSDEIERIFKKESLRLNN